MKVLANVWLILKEAGFFAITFLCEAKASVSLGCAMPSQEE